MDTSERALEQISAEISSLKEQRRAIQMQAERTAEGLKELSDQRAAFAPDAFSSQRGVAARLAEVMGGLTAALDEESEVLSRTKARAEEADRELDQLITKAEVEYHEVKKRLAQRRYEELCKERYAHDEDAEEVMVVLMEVLDRLEEVYKKQVHAAEEAENPSCTYGDLRDTVENWLVRRLHRWLPLESLEKYDAPLPELDPFALKPESQRGSLGMGGVGVSAGHAKPGATSTVSNAHQQNRSS